jgi:23S rRNA (pseudouridine1915-N3)-methyltransferase
MKVVLIFTGKTIDAWLKEGIEVYLKRIPHYLPIEIKVVSASAQKDRNRAMEEEHKSIGEKILPGDFIVVLDESGKEITSRQFASQFEKWMMQGIPRIVFIIGGAFGTAESLRKKAGLTLSVSKFTLTHQMVRLVLVEQIYRALTITRNEGYHHD